MPDLCIHELHRCTICHTPTHARGPALPGGQRSHPFTARYDGTCAGCGFDIRQGETVRYEADGRLVHGRCADG
jgi:hypothetical protein